jgi:ABC-type branched-subunit amino acid transport system substrate-binding protein/predicted negative regulator of RcsB-dependent stress response
MKAKFRIWILIFAFAICSCSAMQLKPETSSEPEDVVRLFSNAENLFQSKAYEQALKVYQEFIENCPSGSNTDKALMRVATIYSNQEKYDLAQMVYQRLITEYPDSEFAIDAMIEIMMFFYSKGLFKEVILQASNIIEKADSKTHLSLTYEVLGDTYMSLKSPKEAIFFYQMAGIAEEKNIPLKLETAKSQLSEEDMLSLSTKLDDQFLRGYFLFERGLYQVQNENYKAALDIFSELTCNYPDHEKNHAARQWVEEIHQRLAFKRRVIGCLLPLTGPYAEFGNRALNGIQFALDQFNRRSNQPAFKIIIKDTRSDPQTAIQAIRQFDNDRVSLIIGPIVTSKNAAQEAQSLGIPIVTLTQRPGIPEIGDYVFRVFLTPQMQIDALLPYVVNQLGVKRFAVLYPEDLYGDTFLKIFQDRALDYGAYLVAVESYKPEQTDFGSQIKKFVKAWEKDPAGPSTLGKLHKSRNKRHRKYEAVLNFDAIFIPDSAERIAMIAPQLAFYDIDRVLLLGTNLWHSDKLVRMARDYVQEAIMTDVFYAEDSKINIREFIAAFDEHYGQRPGFIEALAYDAAMINFHTLSNPKSSPERI